MKGCKKDLCQFRSKKIKSLRSKVKGNRFEKVDCISYFLPHPGKVVHELLHAMGLYHEHTRPDRDQYVDVLSENILDGKFNIYSNCVIREYFRISIILIIPLFLNDISLE